MISFKSRHFPREIILQCVRWYCAYALSYRNIEEMVVEWGIETAKRDKAAALRYFTKAIERNGKPGLVNIDKSGSNKAALTQFNEDNKNRVKVRQCKYLNNIIEQDHRRIKRLTRPMLGFKNFNSAQSTLAGIELVAMIKKGQMKKNISRNLSFADQFYALAA